MEEDTFPSSSMNFEPRKLEFPPISVELVNGCFLVYDEKVPFSTSSHLYFPLFSYAERLTSDYRMVGEKIGVIPDNPCDTVNKGLPWLLMPEQISVLMDYVRLKESLPQLLGSSRAVSDKVEKIPSPCEVDLNKAMMIAKGRKAKQLKRKTHSGAHSAILKIRKTDLNNIKVTDEELKAVVDELSSSSSNHPGFVRIDLPIFDRSLEAYKDVLNFPLPNTTNFRIRCDVFRDLWLRGYYMTDGLKFGCDFLVYENRPGTVHSRWILKCIEYLSNIHPRDIITLSRVSSQVKKKIILAIVSPDSLSPYYVEASWWKAMGNRGAGAASTSFPSD